MRRDLDDMVAWLNTNALGTDRALCQRLAALCAQVMTTQALGLQVLEAMVDGRDASVDAAMNKIMHTPTCQDIARLVLDHGGPEALVSGAGPELLWRQSLTETIGGGTSEIMRSLVARQQLGLHS